MNEDDTVYLHSPPFLVNASRGTENKQTHLWNGRTRCIALCGNDGESAGEVTISSGFSGLQWRRSSLSRIHPISNCGRVLLPVVVPGTCNWCGSSYSMKRSIRTPVLPGNQTRVFRIPRSISGISVLVRNTVPWVYWNIQ
jgi:hypothetical protein